MEQDNVYAGKVQSMLMLGGIEQAGSVWLEQRWSLDALVYSVVFHFSMKGLYMHVL